MSKPAATIKLFPTDFFVAEQLDFALSGTGEHLWCCVEKTGLNTTWIKREWARLLGCAAKDIAHSGLKDRHAVTQQWLSLPAKYGDRLPDSGEGWRIIERNLNERKLRVGSHRYNRFILILRDVEGERNIIDNALHKLAQEGFTNHFGIQRFGHSNRETARHWVARGQLPKQRDERAQVLSTLRADCFNAQLDTRHAAGLLTVPQPGDRAMLSGNNSHFAIEIVDEALLARLASGDIALGGWLPGKRKVPLPPMVQQWLTAADEKMQATVHYLERHAEDGWRALTVRPQAFSHEWIDAHMLRLRFVLPRGSYATTLLDSVFTVREAASP